MGRKPVPESKTSRRSFSEEFKREAVQMLLHSSGTTGLPKGIIYTHATTFASSTAKIIDFGLKATDVVVVFGPLFHAGPLMDLAMPLLLRGGLNLTHSEPFESFLTRSISGLNRIVPSRRLYSEWRCRWTKLFIPTR